MPYGKAMAAGAIFSLLAALGAAQAQTNQNPIDYCREASDGKKERIACLEGVVSRLMNGQTAFAPENGGDAMASAAGAGEARVADAGSADQATGLGAEQLVDRKTRSDQPRKRATATVTEFAYTNSNRLIVFLDNGQVWKESRNDGRKFRISKNQDMTVEIEEGFISGYKLRFTDRKKSIRVERIK